ncbi:exocyst complex component EXO70A1 [Artemisia annua]|uniref:Exocyst complex component EXO70A1 n=1 Tax=Artemisia annua TaxID=35608 RepID=A0A2U1NIR6_ARTAN|nr:exocyst complex component EXO70A1 [Artemisia annua]
MDQPEIDDNSTAEEIILRWDTSSSCSLSDESSRTTRMLFDSDNRHDIDQYLNAINHLNNQNQNDTPPVNNKKVNSTLQIAIAHLEDKFRHLLISHASPIDTDSLSDTTRASTRHSSELDDLTDDVTTPSFSLFICYSSKDIDGCLDVGIEI